MQPRHLEPSYRDGEGGRLRCDNPVTGRLRDRLPALAAVEAYVRACGGDPEPWRLRWAEAQEEADRTRAEPLDTAPAPYRGLARFEPDDRHLFFGRDRMLSELGKQVCGQGFAVLFGPSGSGKSSLLRAGLLPRLRERLAGRPSPAALRILTPGPSPATTYAHLLARAPDEPESWVVVDQFEEVQAEPGGLPMLSHVLLKTWRRRRGRMLTFDGVQAAGGPHGDVPTAQPIGGLLATPGEAVYTLAFAPGGTTLYAGSAHVPVQRYDLDPVHALSRVCARAAGTTLSRAQWHAYVPDAPYRRVCRTS